MYSQKSIKFFPSIVGPNISQTTHMLENEYRKKMIESLP